MKFLLLSSVFLLPASGLAKIDGKQLDLSNGHSIPSASNPMEDIFPSSKSVTKADRFLNIKTMKRWKDRSDGYAIIPYFIGESHYIRVERETDSCSALVGKTGGPQSVHLGVHCMTQGIIQHEFMHALGFHHEHVRPDRDQYVDIYFDNIIDRQIAEVNFAIDLDSETLWSPYDYGSVMHYGSTDFAISGTQAIVPKSNAEIGQRDGASEWDVEKLKLLYQCENGIVRLWDDLQSYPCTSDCKCREGDSGCGSNDDACHGSLICSNNQCVSGNASEEYCGCSSCTQEVWDTVVEGYTCGERITWLQTNQGLSERDACDRIEWPDICTCSCDEAPPSNLDMPYLIWQVYPNGTSDEDYRCIDLRSSDTTNGNAVWYYPCNFTPAQFWYWDEQNNYIRSSIDYNKCLVGADGSSDYGTPLIINDCFENDDRFRWVSANNDTSIRPWNNDEVCIETVDGEYLALDYCYDGYKSFNWMVKESGTRKLQSTVESALDESGVRQPTIQLPDIDPDCQDSPVGWYDILGRNCAWYGEDPTNCDVYGNQYKNFGKTAQSACCVCGGQQFGERIDNVANSPVSEESKTCWDQPNWYDSTGDGCGWYERGNNCESYGSQFPSYREGLTANEACCVCGGGLSSSPPASDAPLVPGCSDSPFNWATDLGIGCEWYGREERNCVEFGDKVGTGGKTANEVCCACRGGFNPTNNELIDGSGVSVQMTSNQAGSDVQDNGTATTGEVNEVSDQTNAAAEWIFWSKRLMIFYAAVIIILV
ncbi:hypothetical protein ACHAXS_009583 [Conticribra weissflogii]